MPSRVILLLCAIGLAMAACAPKNPGLTEIPELILLPPTEITDELLLQEAVVFEFAGERQQLLSVTRIEFGRIRMVFLLPTGQSVLELDYDGSNLVQNDYSGRSLPGREILASFQFALWPEASLRQHYRQLEGWRVEISSDTRSLLTRHGVLLRIDRDGESLVVNNFLHDYRVTIQTLQKTEL